MIKILIGGSPCTYWSIAQKNNRETEAEGTGWELFKNYLIAKEKFKPDLFLYENNKSAAKPIKEQISREMGVDLMHINSALVSAQNRQRFYAFNWTVEQPEDRGILLRDILETGMDLTQNEKAYALTASYNGAVAWNTIERSQRNMVAEPVRVGAIENGGQGNRIYSVDGKSVSQTATSGGMGSNTGLYAVPVENMFELQELTHTCDFDVSPENTLRVAYTHESESQGYRVYSVDHKSCAERAQGNGRGAELVAVPIFDSDVVKEKYIEYADKHGYVPVMFNPYNSKEITDKAPTQTASCDRINASPTVLIFEREKNKNKPVYEVRNGYITIKGKQYPIKLSDGFYIIRKLTVTECCRLQTMPDDYCRAVSNAQAYKGLGNGWTAEVIIHILNGALKDIPRDEELVVLSMYDGIGTGRYCLDKMGFTNVRYYAYEIDKDAMQVAMSNYPDIIQMGDAFAVREPNWTIDEV